MLLNDIALLGLFVLLIVVIGLLALKVAKASRLINVIQSQLTAVDMLNADLQANLSALSTQLGQLSKEMSDTELENNQVSKQLEHRIKQLQQDMKTIADQLTQINEQQPQDKFYIRANKLASLGADVEEIMAECELPRAEVEMLIAIHKKNK